ncbi:GNAT family acetyltransferase [Labrys wisconsinensis]|uniref:Ribosomal protein S18 acetylase RimI-like enzyme n=1 Tax=Labrys wisconsinensis TaxID=425677 RepID=A0ABU0J8I9_9HYPH|nr:GNAT family acetyltransferase [Labrys wisconsinensis]MDQ0470588.1 ribosomal protein S18 acetylase RimI-like enzyme [Labrys wisconsinensis]
MLDIAEIADADIEAVVDLWARAGLTRPWNDPRDDIAFARSSGHGTVLVGREEGAIVAGVMVGHDGHRGAVYYVGVAPDTAGRGHGRAIMAAAEAWLKARGVWKLNLLVRAGNEKVIGFYETLGFNVQDRIAMEKWLDESRRPK